jgi:hypothetical protein
MSRHRRLRIPPEAESKVNEALHHLRDQQELLEQDDPETAALLGDVLEVLEPAPLGRRPGSKNKTKTSRPAVVEAEHRAARHAWEAKCAWLRLHPQSNRVPRAEAEPIITAAMTREGLDDSRRDNVKRHMRNPTRL